LFVADCCPGQTNPAVTQPPAPQPATSYPNLNTQPAPYGHPYYQPQQPVNQPPANTGAPSSGVLPSLYNNTAQPAVTYGQPTSTTPTSTGTQQPTVKKPTYFQEYIVRQGDTINSIAIKFNANAQELALVNNKEPNETLIAGQRLLIPRN
jgi:LysM repeat protein